MKKHFRAFSLLSIFCLTLLSLIGCGEKRIHVSTASGAPGEEMAMAPTEEGSSAQSTGFSNNSVDESNLSSQVPMEDTVSGEPPISTQNQDAIDMAQTPTKPSTPATTSPNELLPSLDSELADTTNTLTSLAEGQDFAAQSSSSSGNSLPSLSTSPHHGAGQDLANETQVALSGEGLEPIPDTFQIAKAEPSGSFQDQMKRIQAEELAAAKAGLEDVFFQFDSWTLTPEGKQTLERTMEWFTQDPSSNLLIEGHADQRGTQAYNMVLAKKRAVAVQDYLTQLGVESSRLAVISYGKDKPFCRDATEVCHQLNRRGHLLIPNR